MVSLYVYEGCSEICQSSTPHIFFILFFLNLSLHYIWFPADFESWGLFIYKRLKEIKQQQQQQKGYVNMGIYRHNWNVCLKVTNTGRDNSLILKCWLGYALLSIGKPMSVLETVGRRIFRLLTSVFKNVLTSLFSFSCRWKSELLQLCAGIS